MIHGSIFIILIAGYFFVLAKLVEIYSMEDMPILIKKQIEFWEKILDYLFNCK